MTVSHLRDVLDLYENDLPSPELIEEEFLSWKEIEVSENGSWRSTSKL